MATVELTAENFQDVIGGADLALVDFWASWCGPCKAMNPALESLAKDFKVCKVNVDNNQELAAHYHIPAIYEWPQFPLRDYRARTQWRYSEPRW